MLVIGAAIVAPTALEAIIGNAEMNEAQTEAAAAPYKERAPAPVAMAAAPPQPPVQFGAPSMSTDPIDLANYQPTTAAPTPSQPANPYAGDDISSSANESSAQASNVVQTADSNNAPPPPEIVALPRPGPKVGTIIGKRIVPDQGRRGPRPGGSARFE